ncbi:hypothetical protein CAPTEDRAFT_220434 [Capitella teleta]|uniref:Rieske domain-containing protein n=1 Tax=Capitella teleta TaxID=283909 RepID=R7V4F0_CAPTE|nr:hypothetical protein CAPTEDRAFT_220434 [Capitella teleta]|eukprot:ELU13703.1 hypothetical protein CAPTEDRAFT_220434 [Capitella teleta]
MGNLFSDERGISFGQQKEDEGEVVEEVVCDENDLNDGQMKEVQVDEKPILLVKEGGVIRAIGGKCTHYGAPLIKGTLCDGRVRCPWHGACFNVATGDIEDFPGLDSLHTFKVQVKNGKVKVRARKQALESNRKLKKIADKETCRPEHILLIGGGPASLVCAETLRKEGYTGNITMSTNETNLPYERVKLSKAIGVDAKTIGLRKKDFYSDHNIVIRTDMTAKKLNTVLNTVTFENGEQLFYDKLLIATGVRPRVMTCKGSDLKNIVNLRSPEDGAAILKNGEGKDVVIVGASFIGIEVAASLGPKAKSLTIVDKGDVPFQKSFGTQVGSAIRNLLENNLTGIKYHSRTSVKEFVGKNNKLQRIILMNGEEIPADLCIVGIGTEANTDWLADSGVSLALNKCIRVDKQMHSNKQDVYAAGDLTVFPLFMAKNEMTNIQHWQMAHQQGRIVALNMLGFQVNIHSVPYFWTVIFGKSLRYAGYAVGFDDIVIRGDAMALKFVAFYTKGDEVVAVASMNYDPIVSRVADYFHAGKTVRKCTVQESPDGWIDLND